MESWNNENTVFVMFSREDELAKQRGFRIYRPYKDTTINGRIIRELWFRTPFLSDRRWYNEAIINDRVKYILVRDPLISRDYLVWLHENMPEAKIFFLYGNMVGKAKHLEPGDIPSFVKKWTYDDYDARTYNLPIYPYVIEPGKVIKNQRPEYDVFFVGRDKNRGEWLLDLEQQLQSYGLKTKFIITKDGRFSKKKKYYQPMIPYTKVLEYDARSRAILNVVMEKQEGITLRDIEAITLNIKLITTNKHIVDKDFYNPNNVFVIGERNINEIADFVQSDPEPIPDALIKAHSFEHYLDVITSETL